MQGVIDKATGRLLRAGYCDFLNDGQLDSGTEEFREDVPDSPQIFSRASNQHHRWTGNTWELVDSPTLLEPIHEVEYRIVGNQQIVERYASLNDQNQVADLVERDTRIYRGTKLLSLTRQKFYSDGSLYAEERWEYFTGDNQSSIIKKVK